MFSLGKLIPDPYFSRFTSSRPPGIIHALVCLILWIVMAISWSSTVHQVTNNAKRLCLASNTGAWDTSRPVAVRRAIDCTNKDTSSPPTNWKLRVTAWKECKEPALLSNTANRKTDRQHAIALAWPEERRGTEKLSCSRGKRMPVCLPEPKHRNKGAATA